LGLTRQISETCHFSRSIAFKIQSIAQSVPFPSFKFPILYSRIKKRRKHCTFSEPPNAARELLKDFSIWIDWGPVKHIKEKSTHDYAERISRKNDIFTTNHFYVDHISTPKNWAFPRITLQWEVNTAVEHRKSSEDSGKHASGVKVIC
jgi:hypothetical protein